MNGDVINDNVSYSDISNGEYAIPENVSHSEYFVIESLGGTDIATNTSFDVINSNLNYTREKYYKTILDDL